MTDLSAIFDAQRALVPARRLSFDLAQRRAALDRLRAAVLAEKAALISALQADFGKHPSETLLTEVIPVLQEIAFVRRNLRRWMRPRRVAPGLMMLGSSARIVPQARGVALVIAPWNYPFLLAIGPVISALAAGCSVVLKPSEVTPATSALLARMLGAVFPADLVAVAEGGAEVATELLALPFDHIFFTGSPQVGRAVMAAAARHLASVTLELGGKCPVIVGADADVAQAARWIAWGRFLNGGQTCVAPDHVFVNEAVFGAFRAALQAEVARMWSAPGDMARIVNARHSARIGRLVEEAVTQGARAQGALPGPVLLEGVTPEMQVSGQEIFGPVLPLMPFSDLAVVVGAINDAPRPLALYVFGGKALADRVVSETSSGAVGVNLTVLTFGHSRLPFGGIGASGQGAAHGLAGFTAFSHMKPVLANRWLAVPLVFAPYGARVRRLIGWLVR